MMDIYKKKMKFLDFPTRYSGDLFYVEKEYDEKLNLFVINHLADIQDLFGKKSIFFNYIPFLILKNRNAILYNYPAMDSEQLNISATSDLLLSFLVDEKQREKFCPSILELDHVKDDLFYVNAYALPIEDDAELIPWMQALYDKLPDCKVMCCSTDEFAYDSFGSTQPTADDTFSFDIHRKLEEVYRQVSELRLRGVSDWVLKQYLFPPKNLSRMVIAENYDIVLPDYHDMVINMEPLVKAVYILFLRHKEGILFKCLSDYREELYNIYVDIREKNHLAQMPEEKIRRSIEALANPLSNSINEKCARAKQAFALQFDESLAKAYAIDGNRGEPKKISLDRKLVEWRL